MALDWQHLKSEKALDCYFCIDFDLDKEDDLITNANEVYINPKIIEHSGKIIYEEGCLSFPGIYEKVNRHEKITLEYQDISGETHTVKATGIESVCLQHELDHLDGIVFIEKLSPLKQSYLKEIPEVKKEIEMKKLNTIFMGNPEFCLAALESLHSNEHINLLAICGGLDKKSGRGHKLASPPTIEFAKKNQVNFIQAENINKSEIFFSFLENTNIDLIVVFAFSHFLGKRILEAPKLGC